MVAGRIAVGSVDGYRGLRWNCECFPRVILNGNESTRKGNGNGSVEGLCMFNSTILAFSSCWWCILLMVGGLIELKIFVDASSSYNFVSSHESRSSTMSVRRFVRGLTKYKTNRVSLRTFWRALIFERTLMHFDDQRGSFSSIQLIATTSHYCFTTG